MKFHRGLLLMTAVNFVLCIVIFFVMYKSSPDENSKMISLVLGWIFWLGIIAFVGPLVIPRKVRREWFSSEYSGGSLVLLLVNVLAAIGGNAIAYSLVK